MPNRVRSDSPISSNAQTEVAQPTSERVDPKLLLAIVATGLMAFIGILTETMTNVLFPTLMAEFHIGTAVVQWLTTGYLLVVSIVTPLSSYLNHRFTLKTSFIGAVVLCIAGSLLAALAVNFSMLMMARILQGAGTGVALPLMFNIILEQSPRSRLGLLMGVGNMVCAIAPALGPTVGGVGVAAIGWRWMVRDSDPIPCHRGNRRHHDNPSATPNGACAFPLGAAYPAHSRVCGVCLRA